MGVVETFGSVVEGTAVDHPTLARKLLLTGYRAQSTVWNVPLSPMPPSKRRAARMTIDMAIDALAHPSHCAMVSLFVPCELLHVAGITPYSVEVLSGYLAGTHCEQTFLRESVDSGMPETMCAFHRAFLGAAQLDLMPAPKFSIYTNLACDGNLMTFPHLQNKYDIPGFFVDVPYERSEDSVGYVAEQLRQMKTFVEDCSGKAISEDALRETVAKSARTAQNYMDYLGLRASRYVPGDITSEMYIGLGMHVLLGTDAMLDVSHLLLRDVKNAPAQAGKKLLWIHVLPYILEPVRDLLDYREDVVVPACEFAYDGLMVPLDPDRPYEAMAKRMVYSCYNGPTQARVDAARQVADVVGADGAVLFAHWGCKSVLGASQLVKEALEDTGLPTLILDGDACDSANSSDGQVSTRLEAFLEMLEVGDR